MVGLLSVIPVDPLIEAGISRGDLKHKAALSINGREWEPVVQDCSRRLEEALKLAKSQHLSVGVVWLPCSLLTRISKDIILMAESEPYGLRGCVINLRYCDETVNRSIGRVKWDESIVSTFEVDLILKHDPHSWTSLLPTFLRNLARGRTIVLSPGYTLEKKKLYRSYSESEDDHHHC